MTAPGGRRHELALANVPTEQEWYTALVDDCRAIITEAIFNSRWALVEGYHALGERIVADPMYVKRTQHTLRSELLQRVAKDLNISGRTIYYAIQFYEKFPRLDKVPEGKNISWKKLITKYLPAPKTETPDMPPGLFRCIVIDPPWPVEKIVRTERPNQGQSLDYSTMSLEEIADLPIHEIAEPAGCLVFLWVTHKFLPDGLYCFEKWGVNYQCAMTWVKPTGMTPYSWMYNTEHVLFGRIGDLQLERLGLKLSFDAPAVGHSVKPDAFYERVLAVSHEPRLEMFARRQREGFTVWGDEVITEMS